MDDISNTFLRIQTRYFSLIKMKLHCYIIQQCGRTVTLRLLLMDDRVMFHQNATNTLWVALKLQGFTNGQQCDASSTSKVIASIAMLSNSQRLEQSNCVCYCSQLGWIDLVIQLSLLPQDSTKYNFSFSLRHLLVNEIDVTNFICSDTTVAVPVPTSIVLTDSQRNQNSCFIERRSFMFMTYEGELRGEEFDTTCERYRLGIIANSHVETALITDQILNDRNRTQEERAFFICYHALQLSHSGKNNEAKRFLFKALEMVADGQSSNALLVQARIHRIFAKIYCGEGDDTQALKEINKCTKNLETAEPSCEKACVLLFEAIIRKKHGEDWEIVAKLFEHAEYCTRQCKDIKRQFLMLPMVSVDRALFLLNTAHGKSGSITKAKECLQRFEKCDAVKGKNIYQLKYLTAQSEVCRLSGEWTEANKFLREANNLLETGTVKITSVDRSELRLDEKLDSLSKKLA